MFTPRNQKFQKQQKGKSIKKVLVSNKIFNFGSYSLRSVSFGRISSKEIEAMYNSINKIIKKTGRIVVSVHAHTPVSRKPIEVRMGKGKGAVSFFSSKIRSGMILCSIDCSNKALALSALKSAQLRLSIKTKIIC